MLKHTAFISVMLLLVPGLIAQNFPELTTLNSRDNLFQQINDDIQAFYRASAENGIPPELSIYQYRLKDGDTLFSLAARLNLPQSSIATINRLDSPNLPKSGSLILIPNMPGMFIPEEPINDLENSLSRRILGDENIKLSEAFTIRFSDTAWRFIVAGDFNGIERRAFLNVLFQNPLAGGELTSSYGMRKNPFTGKPQFHFGIDLAPRGNRIVKSTASGTVINIGNDPIYGIHIRIKHPGDYESLYAHFHKVYVTEGSEVRSGENIGEVGSTGLSTGSHLHFEIFYLNKNRDPLIYIQM